MRSWTRKMLPWTMGWWSMPKILTMTILIRTKHLTDQKVCRWIHRRAAAFQELPPAPDTNLEYRRMAVARQRV